MIATLVVNICGRALRGRRRRRRLNSELLLADAMHTRSDVYATHRRARRAGRRLARLSRCSIRSAALVIAVLIARTGFEIARDTSGILSDRVVIDEEDVRGS